jgi:hypothetical protein
MAAKKRATVRKNVRKTLLEQLKRRGADIALFEDQVEDYMAMWDLKEALIEDIRETGLRTVDGKDNASPKQLPIVNRQMLALLKTLKIAPDDVLIEGEDDL